jgi:hypothetical protein
MPDPLRHDRLIDHRRRLPAPGERRPARVLRPLTGVAPWFAFLGGAAAWALHLVVVYAIVEIACGSDRLATTLLGFPARDVLGFAATLVAALTAFAAAITAYGTFPGGVEADPVDDTGAPEGVGRQRFMAYVGIVMNGLFLIAILGGGLPFLYFRTCALT